MIATTEPEYTGILTPDADLRRALFSDAVMRHPAKQSLAQLTHIAKRLGELDIAPMSNILDCFGGVGSAMFLCSPLYGGHNVATIELAAHFRELQRQAWEHFSCSLDMADIYGSIPPGVFVSLAGDSRQIPQVLAAAGLRDGETFDAIVTSPSYGGSEAVDKRKKQNTTIANHGGGNLAKLRYDKAEMARNGDVRQGQYQQIDRLPEIPGKKRKGINGYGPNSQVNARVGNQQYTPDNIGNESGNKYLASMAQVWSGAAQVLRPGGILVCITRDCVKRGKRVPVGEQNRALIESAGLTFLECETWKVDRLSFWRILQARKNPNAPIIDSEEVMYFVKPES